MEQTGTSRYEHLRTAPAETIIAAVQAMPLRELYELPQDLVEGWPGRPDEPGSARQLRVHRLTTEWTARSPCWAGMDDFWRIGDAARAAGVRDDAVGGWRTNYHNGLGDYDQCFPPPDDALGRIKKPGEKRHPGGIPLWFPSTVLAWYLGTHRVTDDLYPKSGRGGQDRRSKAA